MVCQRGTHDNTRQITPARLNSTIAVLFMIGAACFVVGSVPAYVDTAGTSADAWTFVVGAVFFTSASFCQLLQAQSPSLPPLTWWAWRPHDRGWVAAATQLPGTLCFNVSTIAALATYSSTQAENHHVWRPDVVGSMLFLVSSTFALLAQPGLIAWLNMAGSVLFGISALGAFVLPSGSDVDDVAAVGGTLLGAVCFFAGAALILPSFEGEAT